MPDTGKKAIILLSGGLDSATVLAMARAEGFVCYALSFRYGQKHNMELDAARHVARCHGRRKTRYYGYRPERMGGAALTGEVAVPKDREWAADEIPVTYVPARNIIFLSFAVAWGEVLQASDLFIGANAIDYSGYPDCRPEFLQAYEKMVRVGTKTGVEGNAPRIQAPLLRMTKSEIIKTGLALGVDYSLTRSCYDPDPQGCPCDQCDSCRLRRKGFEEAGVSDPLSDVERSLSTENI